MRGSGSGIIVFIILLSSLVFSIIGNEIVFDCYITTTQNPVVTEEYSISSLSTGEKVSGGRFVYGTGYIDSKRVYYYSLENDEGYTEEDYIPVEHTKIIFTNDEEAKIQVEEYSYSIWLCCVPSHWFSDGRQYVLYLPEDTATVEYSLMN